MTECLGFGDDKYAIQLDADIFYGSARDYDEIKHILDTIGSDLGPGYEYIGSDGYEPGLSEASYNDTQAPSFRAGRKIEKPDNRGMRPYTITGFVLYTFRSYFTNYVKGQKLIGEEAWRELKCGVCYEVGGYIRRGMKLNYDSEERGLVRVIYWPHHACRSYSGGGSNKGLGIIKDVGKHQWMDLGTANIGSFWIQCDGSQGFPDKDTGSFSTWRVDHLGEYGHDELRKRNEDSYRSRLSGDMSSVRFD